MTNSNVLSQKSGKSACQTQVGQTIEVIYISDRAFFPAGKCTYNVRTLYVQARTYGFGTDNIRNESFFDVRVRTYNVRT